MNTPESFLDWRKKIKEKIMESTMLSERFSKECEQLKYVLERTIKHGESDSVLLIGFKGSGKTTILNHALNMIRRSGHEDFIIVQLDGLIHTDDGLALKEIICQLHLQELEGDRVAGSFSDNLLFLLQSLRAGDRNTSKPVVFILDEFHLFCSHRNQTLLYNLFEAAQASWAPICVVGMTSRVDVTELLEKRVKSRFSHRSILLLPNPSNKERLQLFKTLLTFESINSKKKDSFAHRWNENIGRLCDEQSVRDVLEKQLFCDTDEKLFRSFLLIVLCKIPVSADLRNVKLTAEDIKECFELLASDAKVTLLQGLSTLELCLVIAMTHQMELYDNEPFNFEMILNRYLKFAKRSNSVKLSERPVVLKAFERLQALELIIPLSGLAGRTGLKEYQMYNFLLTKSQVDSAVQSYVGLQTDIIQWANSSLDWSGIRVRRLISTLPGYSERESWAHACEVAALPTEGVKEFLEKLFGKYTAVCKVWFLGVPNVNLSSPENVEAVLKSVQHITKGYEYFILIPWLGDGLLTSTGAKWHANRKMLTPAFHFRILESCMPIFNRNAELLMKILKENFANEKTLDVDTFISLCSLDIISEAAMGVRLEAQLQKHSTLDYVNAVKRMGQLCLNRVKAFYLVKDWIYGFTSEGKEHKNLLNLLHSFTEKVIKESKEKRMMEKVKGMKDLDQQPTAFVDILLEMSENEPGLFTDAEIRQEVDTFMFEGHDTTSSSISWSLLLLGHDHAVQERAYNELYSIFGESDRHVTKQDLSKMTYLEAVIKESLRLYPPVSYMSRKLDYDLQLEKYTVPAGSNIIIIPYLLHRQSQLYPDPEKFDPDRFLNLDINRHPFMYIPFSGGPRNCIGQRFAMMEMKVIISYILRHFIVQSVTKREGLKLIFSPILKPLDGIYVKLSSRT